MPPVSCIHQYLQHPFSIIYGIFGIFSASSRRLVSGGRVRSTVRAKEPGFIPVALSGREAPE